MGVRGREGGCYKPNCIPMYLNFVQAQTKIPNEHTMVAITTIRFITGSQRNVTKVKPDT